MGDFGDEVYGFFGCWVEFLVFEFPGVAAVSALQRCFGSCYVEFGLFEIRRFELLEGENEYFSFDVLEFADSYVDFRYVRKVFLLSDF